MSHVLPRTFEVPRDIFGCTIVTPKGEATYSAHTCVGSIRDIAIEALAEDALVAVSDKDGLETTLYDIVFRQVDTIKQHLGITHDDWISVRGFTLRDPMEGHAVATIERQPDMTDFEFSQHVIDV